MDLNNIRTSIEPQDIANSKGKSARTLAEDCLQSLLSAAPYGTALIKSIPVEASAAAEKELRAAFELWANTWIAPRLRAIIAKDFRNDLR